MSDRLYRMDAAYEMYEDDLPEDMTEDDYSEWFDLSYVDMVRIGPGVFRLADQTESPACSP